MTITPERIAELRRLAEAATPGEWIACIGKDDPMHHGPYAVRGVLEGGAFILCQCNTNFMPQAEHDGRYIAAANPQTMLELLHALADESEKNRVGYESIAQMAGKMRELKIALADAERRAEAAEKALEHICPASEGFTEAFDYLHEHGLLVEVPADEAFREEWGVETPMYVWRWSRAALAARKDTP